VAHRVVWAARRSSAVPRRPVAAETLDEEVDQQAQCQRLVLARQEDRVLVGYRAQWVGSLSDNGDARKAPLARDR